METSYTQTGGRFSLPTPSALFDPPSHLRLWLTAAIGLTTDLWSKHWAFTSMDNPKSIVEGVLSFQRSFNTGALWGMGRGLSPLFVIASVVALIFVVGVFAKSTPHQRTFHVALGMIISGALGNLYDRLFTTIHLPSGKEMGAVRDFIKIELSLGHLELWPWIFNVADMLLVAGVVILMLHIWLGGSGTKGCEQLETAESTQVHA